MLRTVIFGEHEIYIVGPQTRLHEENGQAIKLSRGPKPGHSSAPNFSFENQDYNSAAPVVRKVKEASRTIARRTMHSQEPGPQRIPQP